MEEYKQKLLEQVKTMIQESGNPDNFNAEEWLDTWMNTQVPALGGRTPNSFMDKEEGRNKITRILASMQSGAFW